MINRIKGGLYKIQLLVFLCLVFALPIIGPRIAFTEPVALPPIRSDHPKERLDYDLKERSLERKPEIKTRPAPDTGLPEIAPPKDGGKESISVLPAIFVRRFNLEGNTVFSSEELSAIMGHYENREISFEELQSLRRELTLFYINNGYINSGAIIPYQSVSDGVITIKIIEGTLNAIEIEGNRYFRTAYLKKRLILAAGPPLNINQLQEGLQLLQEDRRIKRINAELKPGIMPGEGLLNVRIEEEDPYLIGFEVSNNLSPSVGKFRKEVQLAHQNLTGNGDSLEGHIGFAEGLDDIDIQYEIPITARGTALRFLFKKNNSTLIEDLIKLLDIKSESKTYAVTLDRPCIWTPKQRFSLALTGELRSSSTTYLNGKPLTLSPGEEEGRSNLTVFRFTQEWVNRTQKQVFATRSTISMGIDAFHATTNDSGEDGKFTSWMGQVQWIRRVKPLDSQAVFRTYMQIADAPLMPLEKFGVGGMDTVRGYRENYFVRDNGFVTSLEFRIPVCSLKHGECLVQLTPFWDLGRSWNVRNTPAGPDSISSIGIGLRGVFGRYVNFQFYYGIALRNVNRAGDNIQADGIHFRCMVSLF